MSLSIGCTICYENYKRDDEISNTCCGHVFHSACVQQWLDRDQANAKCPSCMKEKPQVQRLYLGFEEDQPPTVKASLEQCIRERSELEQQLEEANENFWCLQKQYSELEETSREKIAYLTLQNECRISEIDRMKAAQSELFGDIQKIMEKEIKAKDSEYLKEVVILKEDRYALELKVNYLREKYEASRREIDDLNEQREKERLEIKQETCQIIKSHADTLEKEVKSFDKELSDIILLCENISSGSVEKH